VPKARLKNTAKKLDSKEAGILKDRWKAAITDGDLFLHGNDWEYNFLQAENAGMEWLEGRRYGLTEICRFYKTPADLIEAAITAPGSITYQSALQRNLQYLVIHLGPRVRRRENNLTKLLPKPRYVKINTNALLRMDPETQAKVIHQRIIDRTLTPTEGRAFYELAPLTPEQIEEFTVLFGAPRSAVMPAEPPTSSASPAAHRALVHAVATVGRPIHSTIDTGHAEMAEPTEVAS
jgi:phage portal protein BeeE